MEGVPGNRAGDTESGIQVDQAQDKVSHVGDQARYQTRRAADEFQRVLRQHPLTVGALAVGVGAAVGLAVPQTSREHEVMGAARDAFAEKAQEKAEEAENQGLTQE